MLVTYDFRPREDNVVTVYYEGGEDPGEYDVPYRYPRYMVYHASSDWDYAETAANQVFEFLSTLEGQTVTVDFLGRNGETLFQKLYMIQQADPQGDVLPVGVVNNIREVSVNYQFTLIELKEEI